MWAPISVSGMRHIVTQVGQPALADRVIGEMASRFEIQDDSVFQFSAETRVLGDTSITLTTQSPFRFTGNSHVDPALIHIGFLLSGRLTVSFNSDPTEVFAPATAYALPGWEVVTIESSGITRGLDIQLPQARLVDRGVRIRYDRLHLDAAASLGTPLRLFALAVVDAAWSPSMVGSLVVERTIEDLMVGMFLEEQGYAMDSDDLRAGLRARATAQIVSKHVTAGLNPAAVAQQLGVSLRHLQRAFEGSGTSVAQEINRARAASAMLVLSSPTSAGLTLAETAARAGFGSVFELRSALRAHYDTSPSEIRLHRENLQV